MAATESSPPGVFRVNGKDYPIPATLTVGETIDIERYFGVRFGENAGGPSLGMAAGMLWVAIHREDPTATIDDIRAMPMEAFAAAVAAVQEEVDARPPDSEPAMNAENGSSGAPTDTDSPQEVVQRITGAPASAIGVISDPETSPDSPPGSSVPVSTSSNPQPGGGN